MKRLAHGLFGILLVSAAAACGSSINPESNRTFFAIDDAPGEKKTTRYEVPLARLDANVSGRAFVGMDLLDDSVRISRPKDWALRRAAVGDRNGYVEYVSPRGFLFGIYERRDSAGNFEDIDRRYEEDVSAVKAHLVSKEVPVATAGAQGRAYVVERSIPGARAPYVNTSREILLRGHHRVVLVEVVFEGGSLQSLAPELVHVFDTLEVE